MDARLSKQVLLYKPKRKRLLEDSVNDSLIFSETGDNMPNP